MVICARCLGKTRINYQECDRCYGLGYRKPGQCLDEAVENVQKMDNNESHQ